MSPVRIFGFIGLLLVALVVAGTGEWFYANAVFPEQKPERALRSLFQNPEAARVIDSEQHGAFMIGRHAMHTATALVTGERLKLQPYMQPGNPTSIRRVMGGWDACSKLLKHPDTELHFYQIGDTGPGDLDSYVIYHRPTKTYCLIHLQL